jgi:diguanylate cyclase (GGDEF)-like protein
MATSSSHFNEQDRVKALLRTGILDSPSEQAYDDITRLASFICKTPIAYISFITQDRQWYKSRIGIPFSETAADQAICLPVLQETTLVHVPDMKTDPRFKDKEFVRSDLGLRFYAGFPLIDSEGYALGTLCVIDYKVKKLSGKQQFALEALGRQIVSQLELRALLSQQEQASLEITRAHERTANILDGIGSSFFSLSPDGTFMYANEIALLWFTGGEHNLIGKNIWKKFPHLRDSQLYAVNQSVMKDGKKSSFQEYFQASKVWFDIQISPAADGGTTIYAQDITDRKKNEEQIIHQAFHDALTGLPNRTLLSEQLLHACKKAKGEGNMCAVLFVDLDNFKDINDTLGHDAGDMLLKEVAQRFQSTLRKEDIIVRFGGDEFVIIAHGLNNPENVMDIVRSLFASLEMPVKLSKATIQVQGSIGVSLYPHDGTDGETLLKNADIALYEAKRQGRKTHRFFWDIEKS